MYFVMLGICCYVGTEDRGEQNEGNLIGTNIIYKARLSFLLFSQGSRFDQDAQKNVTDHKDGF